MKKFTPVMLILSLLVNIALGVLLYIGGFGGPEPEIAEENLAEIRASGVYGPEGIRIVEGDAIITSAGVTLQNTLITGNLVLAEEIGDGSLSFKNVTVNGSVVVNGGGENTIFLEGVTFKDIMVNQPQKRVRIVAQGRTVIEEVVLQTGALLEEGILEDEAPGFQLVRIHTEEEVDLIGDFSEIILEVKAHLLVRLGTVDRLLATTEAKESYIEFFNGAKADLVEFLAPVELAGAGDVEETLISGVGLTKLGGNFTSITTGGQGIFIELTSGKVELLSVEASEGTVSIHIPQDVTVVQMVLDGKATVTGQGSIENVQINTDGTTIAQTPGKVELAKGITALVGDKELPEPEPEPPPPAPSTPQLPRVSIGSINGISNLYVGDTATRSISVDPGDANLNVSSNNTGVATVSRSGNTVTVTAVKAGSATISVTAKKSGYRDRTVTFNVSVVGPTSIKTFETQDSKISPGKKLVLVELWAKDPQNYRVTLKGENLTFESSTKYFYIEANPEDAIRGNIRVSKR